VDKTEVWLVWNWPDRDGGSEITGFLVEYQEEGEREWDEWKTVSIPESHVTGLEEGKTYRFRVRAENAIGLSRPDTTVPILCQEKLGRTTCSSPLSLGLNVDHTEIIWGGWVFGITPYVRLSNSQHDVFKWLLVLVDPFNIGAQSKENPSGTSKVGHLIGIISAFS